MKRIALIVCLCAVPPTYAFSQSSADRCQALATEMSNSISSPGIPATCSKLEEVRSACNAGGAGVGDIMVQGYKQICDLKQKEVDDARREAEALQNRKSTPVSVPDSERSSKAENQSSPNTQEQNLRANRDQVLQALPVLLQQSLSRTKINQDDLKALIALGQKLGEAYFEKRDGSSLAYTSKQDDALADSRGFRRRESVNFVVYYRTGDMVRAETTLKNAEASIDPIVAIMHHFPSVAAQHGRKLPIYLANSTSSYIALSKCGPTSLACVTHVFFDDGDIQTMYVSPRSYQVGSMAADRVAAYKRTVQHELTHYAQFDMVTRQTEMMPRWFVEGLATYVAGEKERMSDLISDQKAGKKLLSLDALQQGETDIYNSEETLLYYEEGYSIFDMLFSTKGTEQSIALILDVTQQEDFDHALSKILGINRQEFEQQWKDYEQQKYNLAVPSSS